MKTADKWQTTFDAITDLVMILDKDYKIIQVNKAAVDFFKLPVDDILGNTCFSLMHGTDGPPEGCPFGKMKEAKEHQETEIYLEGRRKWINVSVDSVISDRGKIIEVVHIVKDITERKESEDLFRKNQERYRSLFNDFPIGLIELDASAVRKHLNELRDAGTTDFRKYFDVHPEEVLHCLSLLWVVDINRALLSYYGFQRKRDYFESLKNILSGNMSPNKLFKNILSTLSYIGLQDEFKETLITLGRGKTVYETEVSVPTGEGDDHRHLNIRWSVPSGYEDTYAKVLISIIDITALRNAEEALRESEDKYRNVVEKSLAGFFIAKDYIFRFVNKRFCEILGYTTEDICDKLSAVELAHPEDREKVKANIDKRLSAKY